MARLVKNRYRAIGVGGSVPRLDYLPDGVTWRLAQDFVVECAGLRIVVPAGFETNLTSTPRFLWRIWPPTGAYAAAAIVHDYLWSRYGRKRWTNLYFRLLLKKAGVGWMTNFFFYRGVQMGGTWRNFKSEVSRFFSNRIVL